MQAKFEREHMRQGLHTDIQCVYGTDWLWHHVRHAIIQDFVI